MSNKVETESQASVPNKALKVEIEAVRGLEADHNRHEVSIRYKMAQHCRNVVNDEGKRYGANAVGVFADEIQWSTTQVYAYAQVAKTWTEEEVLKLQANKGCTWAHLVILARDKLAEDRESLIEKISEEGLSVRALAQEIAAKVAPEQPLPSADYLLDTSPSVSVVEALQDYGAKLTAFETDGNTDAQRLRQVVQAANSEDLTPAALQQLRQIKKRLKATYEHNVKLVDECIAKAQKANKSKPAAKNADVSAAKQADTSAEPAHKASSGTKKSTRTENVAAPAKRLTA